MCVRIRLAESRKVARTWGSSSLGVICRVVHEREPKLEQARPENKMVFADASEAEATKVGCNGLRYVTDHCHEEPMGQTIEADRVST
jgi:hypothetical protein